MGAQSSVRSLHMHKRGKPLRTTNAKSAQVRFSFTRVCVRAGEYISRKYITASTFKESVRILGCVRAAVCCRKLLKLRSEVFTISNDGSGLVHCVVYQVVARQEEKHTTWSNSASTGMAAAVLASTLAFSQPAYAMFNVGDAITDPQDCSYCRPTKSDVQGVLHRDAYEMISP
eukprot:7619365-Pyramimonas_sp.AAC.1